MKKWFVYDPEGDGYEEFDTEERALKIANTAIRAYLDEGWNEDVTCVTVGEVRHRAKMFNYVERPSEDQIDSDGCDEEGTYWDDWSHMCDYRMEPL